MSGIRLRPYQVEANDAVRDAWERGVKRAAVVLPTGAGKTVTFGDLLAEEASERAPGARFKHRRHGRSLVVVHRIELMRQAVATLKLMAPGLKIGIVKGQEYDQYAADVVVASVATIKNPVRRGRIRDVHTVVVDECHHAPADSYLRVLDHYGCFDDASPTRAAGYTATMIRGDEKALADVWPEVVYHRSIAEMIAEGALVRPRGLRVRVPDLNLRGVRKTAGDYGNADLGKAIEGSLAPERVAEAYLKHAKGRPGLCFAPTIITAEMYADAFNAVGIKAETVHYRISDGERMAILQRFRDGVTQVICNAMVLTEGTDLPMAEVCVIGRPTLNKGLFIQMAGRVLRPSLETGKVDALIMDVSGVSERHSLLGALELFGDEAVDIPEDVDRQELDEEDIYGTGDDPFLQASTELDRELDEGPVWLYGETETVEVDLFRASHSEWLQTYAGMWFLPCGERYILIQRAADGHSFDVVRLSKHVGGGSSWVVQDVPDLGLAMGFGEGDVTRDEYMITKKEKRWRHDRPTEKAMAYARGLGCAVTPLMTKGEVSNLITIALASRRIDPYVPAYARPRRTPS